ncbi:type VI secretion system ATPase TssH [Glaciimonas soli]|uniref:Type VI secretion system ATPase TssH n=1 Tax=Glaciimonas soli TaxID=2590999 RepID=A0A843YXX3_9BURK|nr:type VI secretion system ATPase TssH [Glaciimonas soli]MQR02111.1 type VI secretion system ATPase TssH [Glaciimonas soli]
MAVTRHILFGKLNPTLFKGIESATAFCKLRGNPYIELAHWFNQLAQLPDTDFQRIARHFEIKPEVLDRELALALNALPTGASSISDFSHHIEAAIERAWIVATLSAGDQSIRGAWLIAALLETPELRRVFLGVLPSFAKVPTQGLLELLPAIINGSPESDEVAHDGSGLTVAVPGEASNALTAQNGSKSPLTQYCSDLTEQARAGKIDPVIGRDHEIRTMIDILLRRRQNNPLLAGEAGVGKTAVVEGLALAIAQGHVPPSLCEVKLLSLDVGALLAGASMKGEFESRLKGVLEAATKSPQPIILFVDEVHTLIGAGGQAGTGDAANLLKPALARGTLRTIGATTWAEYKRHIEKDPALTRRFQVLQVMEPEELAAMDMVRGLVSTFTEHHKVWIMDEAVRAAVTLSHRYIPARQLPDKAISLLDTACARVALSLHTPPARVEYLRERLLAAQVERDLLMREADIGKHDAKRLAAIDTRIAEQESERELLEARWQQELGLTQNIIAKRTALLALVDDAENIDDRHQLLKELTTLEQELATLQPDTPLIQPHVSAEVVAAIVADWTGIPVGSMVKDDITAVRQLPAVLAQRVIGQPHALSAIAERIQTSRAQLSDPNKPVGVFLLVGSSGVGKTETALALAEALYGGEQNLITVNMSEFQEAHTVSTLKGSPPGYVGYGEGGVLTEAVRRRPYSVVLLDEIEKAHPDVHEMFYQVFDKGWMEDGEGRYIDFKNTIILLTSNAGSDALSHLLDTITGDTLPSAEALHILLQPELRKVFPAAFIGRLTTVPYFPLQDEALSKIVRLHLQKVVTRMQTHHNIALDITDAVVAHIVEQCGTHETGARLLVGFIEQRILPKLSAYWLDATEQKRSINRIAVDFDNSNPGEKITYQLEYA